MKVSPFFHPSLLISKNRTGVQHETLLHGMILYCQPTPGQDDLNSLFRLDKSLSDENIFPGSATVKIMNVYANSELLSFYLLNHMNPLKD